MSLICLVTDRHRLSPVSAGASGANGPALRKAAEAPYQGAERGPQRGSRAGVLAAAGSINDSLVAMVGAAGKAGIDLIHIRERDLDARELTALVRNCVAAVAGTPAKIVVNDRADVALAAGAHGVHLRSDSIDARSVRRLLPQGAVVGRSVHSADEAAVVARAGGLDYLIFGTLFPTASKDGMQQFSALSELSRACAVTRLPVLAIGGITADRAEEVARSGAAGLAAIGLFLPPTGVPLDRHLHTVANHLRRVFDTCGAVP